MKSLVTAKQNATQNMSVARTQKSHLATQYRLVYFVFEKGKGTKAFSPWCKGHPMSCKFLLLDHVSVKFTGWLRMKENQTKILVIENII